MSSYKREFISGVLYTSIAKYVGIFVQIAISMVLARLLNPADFGILAIATVFISFINLITDFGFGAAIIQSETLEKKDLESIFSLTLYVGLLAAFILFLLAAPIGGYYNNDSVASVVRLLSVNVIFASLNIVPNALLLKAKMFKLVAVRTLSLQIICGCIGITFAYVGFGLYALVIQSILSAAGIFLFNYNQNRIKPFNKVRVVSIKKIINFSAFQFAGSVMNFITKSIDKPLVGKYLSLSSLGYYEKSYRLMQMPVDNLSYVFTPVMQPMFCEFQHDLQTMFQKYKKILKTLAVIGFPLSALLYFSAEDLIHVFYGGKWDLAIAPFQYLSLSVGFMVLMSSSGPIYQASNKVKFMLVVNIAEFVVSVSCLLLSLHTGNVNYVALCISCGIVVRFIFVFCLLSIGVFSISPIKIIQSILPGMLLGILLALVFYVEEILHFNLNMIIHLLLNGGIWAIIIGAYLLFDKDIRFKALLKR